MRRPVFHATLWVFTLLMAFNLNADEKLKGIACRSVHLQYSLPESTAFYNEVTVRSSAEGTYFMVCGWNKGYFGIQELGNGKKLLLFSVWDSNQNNPNAVDDDNRTKPIHKDEKTRIGRFGGEGTGGQSFYDLDWKIGETLRFLVTSKVDGKRTIYSGHFFHPDQKKWVHMVSFSTITGGANMRGFYSFVEDFKRNKASTTFVRKAQFGNGWVKTLKDDWQPIQKAIFTADANPVLNIDAGIHEDRFYLTTGGDTKLTLKLRDSMEKKEKAKAPPPDLPN